MGTSWLVVCVTHITLGMPQFLWVVVIVLNFCFKELRFGLHADSIVQMDFLHVLGSIEGGFISLPNAFKQMLFLFCRKYGFVHQSPDVLHLGVLGV